MLTDIGLTKFIICQGTVTPIFLRNMQILDVLIFSINGFLSNVTFFVPDNLSGLKSRYYC